MAAFFLKDGRPCRLQLRPSGPHRFGGPVAHRGVTPARTDAPLHLLALLDLADENCPIRSDGTTRYLPLYYPLKYGFGGSSVQYAVVSDAQIEILHLSDDLPDADDDQYVRVAELPASAAEILPLRYEEARAIEFAGGYFQPNAEDWAILNELEREQPLILVGGHRRLPVNAGDIICQNRACQFFDRRVWVDVIAAIPPVPINSRQDFWHEYEGGDVKFYFVLCQYRRTIIAFNVAS
jgi:hypothetical protein